MFKIFLLFSIVYVSSTESITFESSTTDSSDRVLKQLLEWSIVNSKEGTFATIDNIEIPDCNDDCKNKLFYPDQLSFTFNDFIINKYQISEHPNEFEKLINILEDSINSRVPPRLDDVLIEYLFNVSVSDYVPLSVRSAASRVTSYFFDEMYIKSTKDILLLMSPDQEHIIIKSVIDSFSKDCKVISQVILESDFSSNVMSLPKFSTLIFKEYTDKITDKQEKQDAYEELLHWSAEICMRRSTVVSKIFQLFQKELANELADNKRSVINDVDTLFIVFLQDIYKDFAKLDILISKSKVKSITSKDNSITRHFMHKMSTLILSYNHFYYQKNSSFNNEKYVEEFFRAIFPIIKVSLLEEPSWGIIESAIKNGLFLIEKGLNRVDFFIIIEQFKFLIGKSVVGCETEYSKNKSFEEDGISLNDLCGVLSSSLGDVDSQTNFIF